MRYVQGALYHSPCISKITDQKAINDFRNFFFDVVTMIYRFTIIIYLLNINLE